MSTDIEIGGHQELIIRVLEDQESTQLGLTVHTMPVDGKIHLFWIPNGYDAWMEGNKSGYSLERMAYSLNGVELAIAEKRESRITLFDRKLPLSESEWMAKYDESNNFAMLAKVSMYEEDPENVEQIANPKLADAIYASDLRESRFIFNIYAAGSDFEVAQDQALAFADGTAAPGYRYFYKITLQSEDPNYHNISGILLSGLDDPNNLPAIQGAEGYGNDHRATLMWSLQDIYRDYVSYDIFRSEDGVSFAKVNDLPYVFSSDVEGDPEQASYTDSLSNNTTIYDYFVRGHSLLGLYGPPSDTISIKGIPARLPIQLAFNDVIETESVITFYWTDLPSTYTSDLVSFNLYRFSSTQDVPTRVTEIPLSSATRIYQYDLPPYSAYYVLEATDINGHVYKSNIELAQLVDHTPPSPPSGLKGQYVLGTRIILDWDANTEEDLEGYRVFMSNSSDGNYIQVTKSYLDNPQYVQEILDNSIVDSIFFKVQAIDFRENTSDYSDILALPRPDNVAPATPLLYKAYPTPAGTELGFKFSSSSDVARHVLQRKPDGRPGWEDILTVLPEDESNYESQGDLVPTCYLDTAALDRLKYNYRFLAYDEVDNTASSEIITILPFVSVRRGEINDFRLHVICEAPTSVDNQIGYNALLEVLEEYETQRTMEDDSLINLSIYLVITEAERIQLLSMALIDRYDFLNDRKVTLWQDLLIAKVRLFWDYEDTSYLQDFQVFRSAEGSKKILYKTLKIEDLETFTFTDDDVLPLGRYIYQIMARHTDGGYSEMSDPIMAKVPTL